jgi:hypothetical protein
MKPHRDNHFLPNRFLRIRSVISRTTSPGRGGGHSPWVPPPPPPPPPPPRQHAPRCLLDWWSGRFPLSRTFDGSQRISEFAEALAAVAEEGDAVAHRGHLEVGDSGFE